MGLKIALAGNPNSGKTTLFNELTGSSQYVGNWPGVTVEKKEGKLKGNPDVTIVDLPGIYSLSPYTMEEVVSRNFLIDERPDAIIDVVDASNLERNLYLTTQFMETGIPVIIAMNMIDIVKKNNDYIDLAKLQEALGCPVVALSALKASGIQELIDTSVATAKKAAKQQHVPFEASVEEALAAIQQAVGSSWKAEDSRYYAVRLLERDQKIQAKLSLTAAQLAQVETIINTCEKAFDDDSESIVISQRYAYIEGLLKEKYQRKLQGKLTISDKIDQIVTNRILALPIFVVVMTLVYYISISTIGTLMTDWVNDVLFTEIVPVAVENFLLSVGTAEWLNRLILDGIVAGVGAVLGFLPQMMVLFLCLAILEDCGYMARIAFIMDRIFRKFGLSGKSFIPVLISTGCGVPGIMATRTIENEMDRRMTIITTTFIPCSAKLPIIALIAGAVFPGSIWVAPSTYFAGIAAIVISGIILKKTKLFAGDPSPFIMELPVYHMPSPKNVLRQIWDRTGHFVSKAGTIILISCVLVWFLSTFNWQLQMVEADESILATLGNILAVVFNPIGWGDWKAAVAAITGLIAKENVVGTLGILYGFEEVAEDGVEIWLTIQASFTPLAAYSFLIFNLLCAPCFAAVGAVRSEMGTSKWTWITVAYQTLFAYAAALMIYQLGMFFTTGAFGIGTVAAVAVLIATIVLLVKKPAPEVRKQKIGHEQKVGA